MQLLEFDSQSMTDIDPLKVRFNIIFLQGNDGWGPSDHVFRDGLFSVAQRALEVPYIETSCLRGSCVSSQIKKPRPGYVDGIIFGISNDAWCLRRYKLVS